MYSILIRESPGPQLLSSDNFANTLVPKFDTHTGPMTQENGPNTRVLINTHTDHRLALKAVQSDGQISTKRCMIIQ